MKTFQEFFCVVYLIHLCCLLTDAQKEGSQCKVRGGLGKCTKVKNCPFAVESMKTGSHGLKRCGFVKQDEIVCCPPINDKSSDVDPIFNGSMPSTNSKEYCDELIDGYNSKPVYLIIDGTPADSGEYPHMAVLGYLDEENKLQWKCGASIISTKFLLTAAHCTRDKSQTEPIVVRLGITKLDEKTAQDYNVKKTIRHPNYDSRKMHHDIALVEVNRSISFDTYNTYPACLYFNQEIPMNLTATGWGATNGNSTSTSNTLMEATLDLLPRNECQAYYSNRAIFARNITDAQFCATYKTGDTCQGDSGGPLQIKVNNTYFIVGITSFGLDCGQKNNLGVYTRVSQYVDWIDEIIWS